MVDVPPICGPRETIAYLGEYFATLAAATADRETAETAFGSVGFLVAGFDMYGSAVIADLRLPQETTQGEPPFDDFSDTDVAIMRGRTRFITRLLIGKDSPLQGNERSVAAGDLRPFRMLQPLSAQDALDQASFIVRTTIDMDRLTDGTTTEKGDVPTCGGPLQALLVTRQSIEWVEREPLFTRPRGHG
jgi:hypothetical protein